MTSENTEKYSNAYATLKEVSEKLQTSADLDVDELVADVTKATKAYQVCKGRIDAATKELETAFTQVNELTSGVGGTVGKENADDVPF